MPPFIRPFYPPIYPFSPALLVKASGRLVPNLCVDASPNNAPPFPGAGETANSSFSYTSNFTFLVESFPVAFKFIPSLLEPIPLPDTHCLPSPKSDPSDSFSLGTGSSQHRNTVPFLRFWRTYSQPSGCHLSPSLTCSEPGCTEPLNSLCPTLRAADLS